MKIDRDSVIITDIGLVGTLERNGYTLKRSGPTKWYDIEPHITSKVTWVDDIPVMLDGTRLVSLFNFASLSDHVLELERTYKENKQWIINNLESVRKVMWNCLAACGIGSLVYQGLNNNLKLVTDKIIEHGGKPTVLNPYFAFAPISGKEEEPGLSTTGPTMLKGEDMGPFNHLGPLDRIVDERLQQKYDAICRAASVGIFQALPLETQVQAKYAERAMYQLEDTAKRIRARKEEERTQEQAMRPKRPVLDPAALLLNRAKDFAMLEDKEAAAHNCLGVYNDLVEQELWGAAGTVKQQIMELGYTVIDGFDPGDPARIAKTVI